MRNLAAILLMFGFAISGNCQSRANEETLRMEAEKYYAAEQYNLAIQYYRELGNLSDQNAEINFQLAESYRKTFNYEEAEPYYLKVHYQAPAEFPLALYYYSLMLKLNGSFAESTNSFSEFISLNQNNSELKEFVEQAIIDQAGSEMARSENHASLYTLETTSVNSIYNDFAPALLDSTTMVITSGRIESNRESIDERYGEAFTDNFYFTKNGSAWQDKTRSNFNGTNSKYNDGSGSFNGKSDKYYFTLCGKDGPHCKIYLSTFKNGKWTTPVMLNENINLKNTESKHPAVSKGGDTLLFSSNRPGGIGGYDLWMSLNAGEENWGPATNLGNTINTKLNELAPAFTKFTNIFFLASDGHQNYGGADIYMAKRFSNGVVALYNLDYPFNSNRDDCFITFDEKRIYFSSNRRGGKGFFDIYSVPIPSVISFVSRLNLKKKDARGDVLNTRTERVSNMNLLTARNEDRIEYENLTYEKKKIVDKMINNYRQKVKDQMSDYPGIKQSEYDELMRIREVRVRTQEMMRKFEKTFLARISAGTVPDQTTSITGVLTDSITSQTLHFRKVLLMDEVGEVIKTTTTNENGQFRFTNIPANGNLFIRLENVATDIEERPIVRALETRWSENINTFSIENIYFDFDHYNLRPEAKQVLNGLISYLRKMPAIQVEIFAYADDLGADDYNMTLTQKRGQSVLKYLTENGVDQTSLAVVAKGRQKNTSADVDVQRQFNRRVEFYVNGAKEGMEQVAKTYILKRKCGWDAIAAATGVSKEELEKLNGTKVPELQLFQPVRLPAGTTKGIEGLFFSIN